MTRQDVLIAKTQDLIWSFHELMNTDHRAGPYLNEILPNFSHLLMWLENHPDKEKGE